MKERLATDDRPHNRAKISIWKIYLGRRGIGLLFSIKTTPRQRSWRTVPCFYRNLSINWYFLYFF